MPTALFLSPHLDDAVFSAGGAIALLSDAGWRTVVATVFTATVLPVAGFALACQLDKGLAPDVDYMALRRDEDLAATAVLGAEAVWLDLPEAPHRGYDSAPALFGDVRPTDTVWRDVAERTAALIAAHRPDALFAPQGLGGHVDHVQVIRAALDAAPAERWVFWRDTPYVIRTPEALPEAALPQGPLAACDVATALDRKTRAACAYQSQIRFQFGGVDACADALTSLGWREGGGRHPAERFIGMIPPALIRT